MKPAANRTKSIAAGALFSKKSKIFYLHKLADGQPSKQNLSQLVHQRRRKQQLIRRRVTQGKEIFQPEIFFQTFIAAGLRTDVMLAVQR